MNKHSKTKQKYPKNKKNIDIYDQFYFKST